MSVSHVDGRAILIEPMASLLEHQNGDDPGQVKALVNRGRSRHLTMYLYTGPAAASALSRKTRRPAGWGGPRSLRERAIAGCHLSRCGAHFVSSNC